MKTAGHQWPALRRHAGAREDDARLLRTTARGRDRLGRLPRAADVAADIAGAIPGQGFTPLEITVPHAQKAGSLAGAHQDPFDRMLIAQAQMEDLPIVSNEAISDSFGVSRLW